VAHLTGTAHYDFTQDEIMAVKAYVEAGGVLLVDQCGGTGNFDQGVTDGLLARAFPDVSPAPLDPAHHPLFRGSDPAVGMDDLTKLKLRPFGTQRRVDEAKPVLGFAAGKGHVIFTPLDVTSGLLATRTWGIAGIHPDYAGPFVQNLLLWTLDGQADN